MASIITHAIEKSILTPLTAQMPMKALLINRLSDFILLNPTIIMICFIITHNQTVLCAIQVVFSAIYLYFTMYSIYSDFIFWRFSTSKPHSHNIGHKNRKKGTRCPRGFPQFIVCSISIVAGGYNLGISSEYSFFIIFRLAGALYV